MRTKKKLARDNASHDDEDLENDEKQKRKTTSVQKITYAVNEDNTNSRQKARTKRGRTILARLCLSPRVARSTKGFTSSFGNFNK